MVSRIIPGPGLEPGILFAALKGDKSPFPSGSAGVTFGSVCLAFPEQGSASYMELLKFGLLLGLVLVLGTELPKSVLKMKLINLHLMTDFCFFPGRTLQLSVLQLSPPWHFWIFLFSGSSSEVEVKGNRRVKRKILF